MPALVAQSPASTALTQRQGWLLSLSLLSLFVVFQHFGLSLLPDRRLEIPATAIHPLGQGASVAYQFAFDGATPDRPHNPHSRVQLLQDGRPLESRTVLGPQMYPIRNGAWAHAPGLILFSASDNSDPRTGSHRFTICYPWLAAPGWGLVGGLLFVASTSLLWRDFLRFKPAPLEAAPEAHGPWRGPLLLISLVFLAGLYCNTGTLSPYASSGIPRVDVDTGYLYNIDHGEFRALYHFVNGAERTAWEHAILLRRVLYPVLAWPFMRLAGFELGGTLASLAISWLGLILALHALRRQVGRRGALFAGLLLAVYPGAAYWSGLPYLYAVIVPGCLLLMAGIVELSRHPSLPRTLLISLGLGFGYLAYDFVAFFLPASVLVLALQRRWNAAVVTVVGQVLPILCWLAALRWVFHVPALNSNTGIYDVIVRAYLSPGDLNAWFSLAGDAPAAAWNVWFGANFQFLPLLALAVLALNPVTSRVRPTLAGLALLASVAALFAFINLSPLHSGPWVLRGSWVSRIYQPALAVCIYACARWWQHLPPLSRPSQWGIRALVALVLVGNAVITFGPILGNPGGVAGEAFFRFYTHTDVILIRSLDTNLTTQGRRPIGFPRRSAP